MKITIIYDNTSVYTKLKADWGFSCYIETEDRNILFDAGGNGKILLDNMSVLGIDPKVIDDIFISHQHFDHIGGLSAILNENDKAVLHIPPSLRGIKYTNKIIQYNLPTELYKGIYTTGELKNIEQSLFIDTPDGSVVIIGCCHPGLESILSVYPDKNIKLIVGGLHGSTEYEVMNKAEILCATHCTKYKKEIENSYNGKYIQGGVGSVIDLKM